MDAEGTGTRDRIVGAADELFYQQGFQHTSFADIADAVGISRGNFYYHFKSKDEILAAVIDARIAERRRLLRQWEGEQDTAAGRIRCYINIVTTNGADITKYGCPVGTLTTELAKLQHGSLQSAAEIFTLFRTWLGEQFAALGRAGDADELAMHVLSASQGIATMSHAYQDHEFVCREVDRLCAWVDAQAEQEA
jgi:TetR/AcrR family transcriptional regulator, transcriptional repressor for nem operon